MHAAPLLAKSPLISAYSSEKCLAKLNVVYNMIYNMIYNLF